MAGNNGNSNGKGSSKSQSSKAHPDQHLSDAEFLRKHWGSWENFMICYGVKPYAADAYEEAQRILDALREPDESDDDDYNDVDDGNNTSTGTTTQGNNSSGGGSSSNANVTQFSQTNPGQPMSDYEYLKPYGGMKGFMASFGIKPTPEGFEEARELLDQMRQQSGAGKSPYRQ